MLHGLTMAGALAPTPIQKLQSGACDANFAWPGWGRKPTVIGAKLAHLSRTKSPEYGGQLAPNLMF